MTISLSDLREGVGTRPAAFPRGCTPLRSALLLAPCRRLRRVTDVSSLAPIFVSPKPCASEFVFCAPVLGLRGSCERSAGEHSEDRGPADMCGERA